MKFPLLLRAWCKCACITGYVRVGGGCPLISLCSGNMLIQPAIFLRGGHVPFFSHQPVSMELMGPSLCPPVYSMGDAVGSLERLHHLLLPGRRRPVQGETFFFRSSANLSTHLWAVNISRHKSSPLPEGLVAGSGRREQMMMSAKIEHRHHLLQICKTINCYLSGVTYTCDSAWLGMSNLASWAVSYHTSSELYQ